MKVLIAVTHLLGAGHLSRAATLARAFAQAGHDVTLVSGGRGADHLDMTGFRFVQVPPLASDGTNFTRLLDEGGKEADARYLQDRSSRMVACLQEVAPDAVITELFPFGRRALAGEFLALLGAAHDQTPRPVVLSSIRDILAPPSKPAKAERTREILTSLYDGVLVHSDPAITQLGQSWPVAKDVAPMLHYTGYVAPPAADLHPLGAGRGEVLVSAGGGSVGQGLFECALEAARQSPLPWRLLVGGGDRVARVAALKERVKDPKITIETVRPDFRQMLTGAAASVSMCGYNTALDLLQTGLPSVLVPFDDGGEVEQTLRARALAHQPAFEVLSTAEMTPASMARAVANVVAQGRRDPAGLADDGAACSVDITRRLVAERRA